MENYVHELQKKKWGVFHHYMSHCFLDPNSDRNMEKGVPTWNECVEMFDTDRLAYSLHKMGAGYYFITIMQVYKYMIAPNATYDKIAGIKPGEACATRDLPLDLYKSLSKYGIDLCLYYTGDGPCRCEFSEKFGYVSKPPYDQQVTREFVEKWASVLQEYSERYGDKVKAWWFDGVLRNQGYNDELIGILDKAAKAGNPRAACAFNNGYKSRLKQNYINEEFTAGEINYLGVTPSVKKDADGNVIFREAGTAVPHALTPLGYQYGGEEWEHYGKAGVRYTKEFVIDYINTMNKMGGFVTLDMFAHIDGSLDPEQEGFMRYVGNHL